MDREAMEALRYDRRLAKRRGWIEDEELAQAEAGLPDVGGKATTLGDAADAAEHEGEAAPATPPQPEA